VQEVRTNPSFKICLKKGLLLRSGFVVEGGERERYALRRVFFLLGPPSQPNFQKKELDWTSFFLRFGFVVEGRRDDTSSGIKEMKWNPKRSEAQSNSQKK